MHVSSWEPAICSAPPRECEQHHDSGVNGYRVPGAWERRKRQEKVPACARFITVEEWKAEKRGRGGGGKVDRYLGWRYLWKLRPRMRKLLLKKNYYVIESVLVCVLPLWWTPWKHAHRPIWRGQFLNWGSRLPDDRSLANLTETQPAQNSSAGNLFHLKFTEGLWDGQTARLCTTPTAATGSVAYWLSCGSEACLSGCFQFHALGDTLLLPHQFLLGVLLPNML